MRPTPRAWAPLGIALLVPLLAVRSVSAAAEPYLSVRTGFRCSQCHVNRTGGGGRTEFGTIYAQTRLAVWGTAFRSPALNELFSIGANFRVLSSGTVSQATPRTAVAIEEANLQLEARLITDVLAVYVDETVGPGSASTREAFILLERLPLEGFVKAGKFLLPYGLRLVDDAEFVRQRTGFTYDTPDQGVEVGIEPGPLSFFLALSNGTQGAGESNSEKQLTASAALVFPRVRFGASAARNDAPNGRRDVVGGFGGLSVGRFTFLGELDAIRDSPSAGPDLRQFAAYLEGDFLVRRGLNLKTTYGFLDPNRAIGENARIRVRFGLEAFPVAFLQLSTFYVLLQDIPQATTDLDQVHIELHAYF